jgi:ribonuclease Y
MLIWILVALVGLALGFAFIVALVRMRQSQLRRLARREAASLIKETQEAADDWTQTKQREFDEYAADLRQAHEAQMQAPLQRVQKLESLIESVESDLQDKLQAVEKKVRAREGQIQSQESRMNNHKHRFKEARQKLLDTKKNWAEALLRRTDVARAVYLEGLKHEILSQTQVEAAKSQQAQEDDYLAQLEKIARSTLNEILSRFARPYCAERGIKNINFPNAQVLRRSCGPQGQFLKVVEELIGVDLTLHEDRLFLNVSAFDPVRRELTRMVFERLMNERDIDEQKVRRFVGRCQAELLRKLSQDGHRVSQELKLQNFHPEIKNMLGALRYRYSFSQNQHFHVAEVGWLCGLLASELALPTADARRAGVLHDIGKAMDHSIDGGHAVIGADFIDRHGEATHIVHAVRAHHYDEAPSTELAYLVIAADALSGARPGARRSTADSYSQKMEDLTRVSQSFDGVLTSYIVSAGREIRVIVDSERVSDMQALEMSKKMAAKIEEECTYPGQVRVTVVRKTQAVEYAR